MPADLVWRSLGEVLPQASGQASHWDLDCSQHQLHLFYSLYILICFFTNIPCPPNSKQFHLSILVAAGEQWLSSTASCTDGVARHSLTTLFSCRRPCLQIVQVHSVSSSVGRLGGGGGHLTKFFLPFLLHQMIMIMIMVISFNGMLKSLLRKAGLLGYLPKSALFRFLLTVAEGISLAGQAHWLSWFCSLDQGLTICYRM